ncbi:MAG: hypothetical protein Q8P93_04130 [bacterium]|nr:hypothetical protein [bacterium]
MKKKVLKSSMRYRLASLKDTHPELFWVGLVSSSITITKEFVRLVDTIIYMVVG